MVSVSISKMSKLSFRARALDASKPMPIYLAEELPDLPEASINRSVPQMPTGMEKDEECERHLQDAITARQSLGDNKSQVVIPTPEVFEDHTNYDLLYPPNFKIPKQFIHVQPFHMEEDYPEYDVDSEDEQWLKQHANIPLSHSEFEEIIDNLEKGSGQHLLTLKEAKMLLKYEEAVIGAVYEYWVKKRTRWMHPLILTVKTDKHGVMSNNPYVAFRRRTEKMQTRKNRKNDETSYEKMLKLRRDLSRAVTLLEMIKKREKTKRDYISMNIDIFKKRYELNDFSGEILADVTEKKSIRAAFTPIYSNHYQLDFKDDGPQKREKRSYKKRRTNKHVQGSSISSVSSKDDTISGLSKEDEKTLASLISYDEEFQDTPFGFRRKKSCLYNSPKPFGGASWPWVNPEDGGAGDKRFRYCLTSIAHPKRKCLGFSRRRIGRGGRMVIDRAVTPFDDLWSEILTADTEHLNDEPPSELSNEIKNEWLHFMPKLSEVNEDSSDIPSDKLVNSHKFDPPSLFAIGASERDTDTIVSIPDPLHFQHYQTKQRLQRHHDVSRLQLPSSLTDHEYASTYKDEIEEWEHNNDETFSTGCKVSITDSSDHYQTSLFDWDWDSLDEEHSSLSTNIRLHDSSLNTEHVQSALCSTSSMAGIFSAFPSRKLESESKISESSKREKCAEGPRVNNAGFQSYSKNNALSDSIPGIDKGSIQTCSNGPVESDGFHSEDVISARCSSSSTVKLTTPYSSTNCIPASQPLFFNSLASNHLIPQPSIVSTLNSFSPNSSHGALTIPLASLVSKQGISEAGTGKVAVGSLTGGLNKGDSLTSEVEDEAGICKDSIVCEKLPMEVT